MKSSLTIWDGLLIALYSKDNKTAKFSEIEAILKEKGLFSNRKSAYSLAEEIELRITASTSRKKRWFIYTKPDILSLNESEIKIDRP